MQRYADFYANLGYSSIQLGLNTAALKGLKQMFSEQGHWNDAERQIYTDIMARDTLKIENLVKPVKMSSFESIGHPFL